MGEVRGRHGLYRHVYQHGLTNIYSKITGPFALLCGVRYQVLIWLDILTRVVTQNADNFHRICVQKKV